MNRVLCVVIIALLMTHGALGPGLDYHRGNAVAYRARRGKNAKELESANAAITGVQMRQCDTAALDARYSGGLVDMKAKNETLRTNAAADRKHLRINATYPGPMREATGTARVDNATGPQLVDIAERDYFILRGRLMIMQKQLEGAQGYIRTQCTKLAFCYPEGT